MFARLSLALLVSLALGSSACRIALTPPANAYVQCTQSAECPPPLICSPVGKCVPPDKLDATPPEIGSFEEAGPSRAGDTATFRFAVSEPMPSLEVALDAVDAGQPTCTIGDDLFAVCTYSVTGNENGGFGGVIAVRARGSDDAGNKSERPRIGTLNFDFTPPVLAAVAVSPAQARLGDQVHLFVTVSEPLRTAPVVLVDPSLPPITLVQDQGTLNYRGVLLVESGTVGTFRFSTSLVDVPGNISGVVELGSVTVDPVVPSVVASSLSKTVARAGAIVTLTLDLDEATPEAPIARMGNALMTLQTREQTHFVYAVTIDPIDFSDDVYPVAIEAEDSAGNRLVVSLGTVRVDSAAPAVVASVGPAFAKAGDSVQLLLSASEPLSAPPIVSLSPVLSTPSGPVSQLVLTQDAGTLVYRGSVVADAVAAGAVAFSTQVVDAAGNTSGVLPMGSVHFDSRAPVVTSSALSTALARDGTIVTFDLALDEIPSAPPLVKLGNDIMLADGGAVAPSYAFSLSIDALSFPDDVYPVSIEAADAAGNRLFGSFGSVRVDTTPPEILAGTVSIDVRGQAGMPDNVSALGGGASVRVSFLTSEPVFSPVLPSGPPVPSGVASFSALSSSNVSFSFDGTFVDGAFADGDYDITFAMADAAGNTANATLGRVTVDREAPTALDTTAWVHLRVPWGSAATLGVAEHFLADANASVAPSLPGVGEAATCPPDCLDGALLPSGAIELRAYNTAGARLASVSRGPSGFPWAAMSTPDASHLLVSAVDVAGNEGPKSPVAQEEWLATLVGKVAGEVVDNPHAFETWTRETPAYEVASFGAFSDAPATPAFGGVMAQTRAQPWLAQTARAAAAVPGATSIASFAYDNVRHRILMVNRSLSDTAGTVWSFDGEQWTSILPTDPEGDGNPIIRTGAAVTFDTRRGVLLMFGGAETAATCDGRALCDILWEFNGVSWVRHLPSAQSPQGQDGAAMAFDSRRGVAVLFGGDNLSSGVWEWDGTSWAPRCSTVPCINNAPVWRTMHRMAYDAQRGVTVMYGGLASAPVPECGGSVTCGSTWEWDGTSWQQMCTSAPCNTQTPGYRSQYSMAFEASETPRVLLFGGAGTAGGFQNNLWAWDGTTWSQQCTSPPCSATLPTGRNSSAAAYYPGTGLLIGLGASTGCASNTCNDLWSYKPSAWTQQWPRTAMPPTDGQAIAATSTDLFVVGGSTAQQICSSAFDFPPTCPSSGTGPAKCAPGALYLMGPPEMCLCQDGAMPIASPAPQSRCGKRDMHRFVNGASWQKICTVPPCNSQFPPGRDGHSMAADEAGRLVVFGGETAVGGETSTYVYDGSVWTRFNVSAPGWRKNAAMTRAPGGGVLLFGGENTAPCDGTGTLWCNGTWLWRSNAWTRCAVGNAVCPLTDPTGDGEPSRRNDAAMAFDTASGHAYLFGGHVGIGGPGLTCPDGSLSGSSGDCFMNDLWRFDGSDWLRVDSALPPGALRPDGRSKASMYYDSVRQALVVGGGGGLPNACDGFAGCSAAQYPCSCATDREWVWNGTEWQTHVLADPTFGGLPPRGTTPVLRTARTATASSAIAITNASQTFKLYPGTERVAHLGRFVLDKVTSSALTLDDLSLSWTVGATGDQGGCSSSAGLTLERWDAGWQSLTTTSVGNTLRWSATTDAALQSLSPGELFARLTFGASHTFSVRARPTAAKGCETIDAGLTSESLQVRVRYH